jgi:glycosyltransferase involved in cell wall biosynthesis
MATLELSVNLRQLKAGKKDKMKKILFVLEHMLCGGVERALLNILEYMNPSDYEITIQVISYEGEFIEKIPTWVRTEKLPVSEEVEYDVMVSQHLSASIKHYLERHEFIKVGKMLSRRYFAKDPFAYISNTGIEKEKTSKMYDIAICFHIHQPFLIRYVAENVKAALKYAWIHNDFKTTNFKVNMYKKWLIKYDKIFAVSEQIINEFCLILPKLAERTELFPNIINKPLVIESSMEFYPEEYDGNSIILLSIGRLTEQKGFDIAIEVASLLREMGINFIWYIIGDGEKKEELQSMVFDKHLSEFVYLLGNKSNPYPYIKNCDIYIQPSRHEGYGIAVAEARILQKPIIVTDFAGAREQIVNQQTGVIVPCDTKEIFNAIVDLVKSEDKRELFSSNLGNASNNIDSKSLKSIEKYF